MQNIRMLVNFIDLVALRVNPGSDKVVRAVKALSADVTLQAISENVSLNSCIVLRTAKSWPNKANIVRLTFACQTIMRQNVPSEVKLRRIC